MVGGGGGGGAAGPCAFRCVDVGPPPPPSPPPWAELIEKALFTEAARPTTGTKTDEEYDKFVEESFTRSLKDLKLTEKELRRYFKFFPGFEEEGGLSEEFENFLTAWNNQPGNCMKGGGKSWVYYHPLDAQDRASGGTACLGADAVDYRGRGRKADPNKDTDIMGCDTTRGRGTDRSNPAGRQHLDGRKGWARGHLLGRQLGGNGRDRRNLVKMYDEANSVVMAQYEETVRSRLDAGERVFYASVPRYDGNSPVPKTIDLYALGSSGSFSHWTVCNTPNGLPPGNGVAP